MQHFEIRAELHISWQSGARLANDKSTNAEKCCNSSLGLCHVRLNGAAIPPCTRLNKEVYDVSTSKL
jgi:hypothetical protein